MTSPSADVVDFDAYRTIHPIGISNIKKQAVAGPRSVSYSQQEIDESFQRFEAFVSTFPATPRQ
jgi:hypothetical protein